MKRNPAELSGRPFDILVVGGGIHGAALAREASLCGFSTALIEKDDFGGATSANSLKIIHGGLRYLQQLDVVRLRTSVVERRAFLTTAPHLVHPLQCVMPTRGHAMKGREAMFCGLLLNELLSFDRNRLKDAEKRIPSGRLIKKTELALRVPDLPLDGVTGGCSWYDAYTYNSERLVSAMVRDAALSGAAVANYIKLTGFSKTGNRISAARVVDQLNGTEFEIPAKLTVLAAGPWADEILVPLGLSSPETRCLAMGMNVVLRKPLLSGAAAGLQFRRRAGDSQRLLFLMPWRGRTLAGTYYRPHRGPADSLQVTEEDIAVLLSDLSQAYPAAHITRDDIVCVLAGLLPAKHNLLVHDEPVLSNHFSILDHSRLHALEGLITMVGVKYTTARDVAARAIRCAAGKLGRPIGPSATLTRPLPGGHLSDFNALLRQAKADRRVPPVVAEHLCCNYGDEADAILQIGQDDPLLLGCLAPSTPVIGAEIVNAVRNEMAVTLSDVVLRRTDLGTAGCPEPVALDAASRIMGRICGWDDTRRLAEIAQVQSAPIYGGRR